MKTSAFVLASLLGAGTIASGTMAFLQQPTTPFRQTTATSPAPKAPEINPRTVAPIDVEVKVAVTPSPAAITETAGNTPTPAERSQLATPSSTNLVRQVTSCKILMAIVKDINPPLNVRSGPDTSEQIVGTVSDGQFVSVQQEQNGWLKIAEPQGWIAKSKTASRCGQKVEQVRFGSGKTGATISDEFLGTGSHKYKMALGKGQKLTIKRTAGPMPSVIGPDGKYITEMNDTQQSWSAELPSSGEYTFEMASNFKGYKYDFAVEVQ